MIHNQHSHNRWIHGIHYRCVWWPSPPLSLSFAHTVASSIENAQWKCRFKQSATSDSARNSRCSPHSIRWSTALFFLVLSFFFGLHFYPDCKLLPLIKMINLISQCCLRLWFIECCMETKHAHHCRTAGKKIHPGNFNWTITIFMIKNIKN